MIRKFFFAILFLFSFGMGFSVDINNCTSTYTISTPGNYSVINDINSTLNCISITSDNVTLDCQGFWLTGSGSSIIRGINLDTVKNVSVNNCNVKKFGIELYLSNSHSVKIINSTFYNSTLNYNTEIYGSYNNTFKNLKIKNGLYSGIYIYSNSYDNTFYNVSIENFSKGFDNSGYNNTFDLGIIKNNGYGLSLSSTTGVNIVKNSYIINNSLYGIYSSSSTNSNILYNNFFNNTGNYVFGSKQALNTTKQAGINILGENTNIGGNFWANPLGSGRSQVCADSDNDGICDKSYSIDTNNIDYLPITHQGQKYKYNITGCRELYLPGTYYLINDIINTSLSNCIDISSNNVTLDCQNHVLDGGNSGTYGIFISRTSSQTTNITIKNCKINDWGLANVYLSNANGNKLQNILSSNSTTSGSGILLSYSNNNVLDNIYSKDNFFGITIYGSNNLIKNSTLSENKQLDLQIGNYFYLNSPTDCNNNLINVTGSNGNEIGLYNSPVSLESKSFSELILCNASNSNLNNIIINGSSTYKNNGLGIILSDNVNVTKITSTGNLFGTLLYYSSNNYLQNLVLNNNFYNGFEVDYSNNNQFKDIEGNSNGYNTLYLSQSSNNLFDNINGKSNVNNGFYIDSGSDNNTFNSIKSFYNSYNGFYVYNANKNTIKNSYIINNTNYGIYLNSVSSNLVYNNYFFNNNNYFVTGTSYLNLWNITTITGTNIVGNVTIGGNFWGNSTQTGYSQICADTNLDGFCDAQLNITANGNNTGYLPLYFPGALPSSNYTYQTATGWNGTLSSGVVISSNVSSVNNTSKMSSTFPAQGFFSIILSLLMLLSYFIFN